MRYLTNDLVRILFLFQVPRFLIEYKGANFVGFYLNGSGLTQITDPWSLIIDNIFFKIPYQEIGLWQRFYE